MQTTVKAVLHFSGNAVVHLCKPKKRNITVNNYDVPSYMRSQSKNDMCWRAVYN